MGEQLQRKGREGARWINERPSPEEFGEWARKNIKIDEKLDMEDYVGGIVLIPAVDKKSKYVAKFTSDGNPVIGERPEMVYIPYPKVETRLQYFWDLLGAHEEWEGVIEPIVTERPELNLIAEEEEGEDAEGKIMRRNILKPATIAAIVHQLPAGFFVLPVPQDGGYAYFLCCSYRVAIYARNHPEGRPVREGRGTKQVALLTRGWNDSVRVDDNAIMKAETGAIGRALGAAGIFNIPGSGVATAEDMLEAAAAGTPASDGAGPEAPSEAPVAAEADDETLQACRAIMNDLREHHPTTFSEFGEWCQKRRPRITKLSELDPAALRGVRNKLERLHTEALERAAATAEAEVEPDVDEPPAPDAAI
jgi:hypothetical protein